MRLLFRLALALALLAPIAADARPIGYSYKPGRSIKSAAIVNGMLVLVYADGTEATIGRVVGPQGERGDSVVGPPGPAGKDGQSVAGPPGPPGADGKSVTGPAGATGRGIGSTAIANKRLVVTFTDGATADLGVVVGQDGAPGPQGAAGVGTKGDRGDKGDKGDAGQSIVGPPGAAGATGPAGVTPTLAIGAITTGAPGSAASVTARQPTPNTFAFDFAIPAGQPGAAGASAARCAKKLSTLADGTFSWPITSCGLTAPVVSADVEATGARDFVATLTTVSASTVTGRVRRSRTLPATLLNLLNLQSYDPFEAPGIVTVHLTAQESAP